MTMLDMQGRLHCPGCGEGLVEPMRFCPYCGAPVEDAGATVVLDVPDSDGDHDDTEADMSSALPADEDETTALVPAVVPRPALRPRLRPTGRASRATAGVLAAALVLGAGYGGYRAYANHQQYKAQVAAAFATADGELQSAVDDLQDVKRTADVRKVAKRAAEGSTVLDGFLPDLGEQEAAQARRVRAALAQIGAMSGLDADSLGDWKSTRPELVEALESVVDENSQPVGVNGSDQAVAAVSKVVTRGRAKLANWREQRATAVADRRADLAAFDSYSAGMNSQIATYASMRDDTAAALDAMRADADDEYYHDPVYELFSSAMYDRIDVRDSMNALPVPSGMETRHAEIVSAVSAGIAGMDQLLGALDDNNSCDPYFDDDCYLSGQPLWEDFQSTSDEVTRRYGQAVDAWRASLPAVRAAIENRPLPEKPVV
jgi:hypothetical protein